MTEQTIEQLYKDVTFERDRLYREVSNLSAENDRLRMRSKNELAKIVASAVVVVVLAVALYFVSVLFVEGAKQAAELETEKSLACIDTGGIWDKRMGSCAWSQQ